MCKKWAAFFSPSRLLQAAGVHAPPGVNEKELLIGIRYMLLSNVWDLEEWETLGTAARCKKSLAKVVQGHLREVSFNGAVEEGILTWRVMPSVKWTGFKTGYLVSSNVKNGVLSFPICRCPVGYVFLEFPQSRVCTLSNMSPQEGSMVLAQIGPTHRLVFGSHWPAPYG